MPLVLRVRGYRFGFYEVDLDEPPHVQVGKYGNKAKFWVQPLALARAGRFRPRELCEIEDILEIYQADILAAWEQEQYKRDGGTRED